MSQLELTADAVPEPRVIPNNHLSPTLDAQALIVKAIEHNVPIETLERLFTLREKIRDEQARNAFFEALSAFQAECPIIGKNKPVKNQDGSERYRYAPLEVIVEEVGPYLTKHGFSYTLDSAVDETQVTAICTAHHVAGHSRTSTFRAPIDPTARMNVTQKVAAADTYAGRYAFRHCFGILTGEVDDDAQSLNAQADEKFPRLRGAKAKPADVPARITEKQHQALRVAIREFAEAWGQEEKAVTQRIKDRVGKQFSKEHFPDLSVEEFSEVNRWIAQAWMQQQQAAK